MKEMLVKVIGCLFVAKSDRFFKGEMLSFLAGCCKILNVLAQKNKIVRNFFLSYLRFVCYSRKRYCFLFFLLGKYEHIEDK